MLPLTELSAPCLRVDLDVAEELPSLPAPEVGGRRCGWFLVRFHTEPLGTLLLEIPRSGLDRDLLAQAIVGEFGAAIAQRTIPEAVEPSEFVQSRDVILRVAPQITVVVCTRERPDGLKRCLDSLVRQVYPRFSILVVDNAPVSEHTRTVVDRFDPDVVRYVVEPRPGLSRARNRALVEAASEIIAWIDDDEIADKHWLAEIARGFYEHPAADAVSGIMVPAELETWAQVRFEQYGGHNKHRGFRPVVFSPETRACFDPLYPLPPFGTGGNMAFRRRALIDLGGFDAALGAGSPALGSEDTKAFSQILLAGGTVVYQPTAVTHHFHRREHSELEHQMFGYGTGLTAYYASMVASDPALLGRMLRLIPSAYADVVGRRSLRSGHLPVDFPRSLRRANRRGLLRGPGRYILDRWRPALVGASASTSHPEGQDPIAARTPVLNQGGPEECIEKVKVLYIGGYGRSGSTLLMRMIGNASGVAVVGELAHIWRRGYLENQLCGCGVPFRTCDFWAAVSDIAFGCDPGTVPAEVYEKLQQIAHGPRTLVRLRIPRTRSDDYRASHASYGELLERMYRAIASSSGARLVVDSSKMPPVARMLSEVPGVELHVVHLVRDSRATAFSWQRSKIRAEIHWAPTQMDRYPVHRSSSEWMLENSLLFVDRSKPASYTIVRYEDLVRHPATVLTRIATAIGEPSISAEFLDTDREVWLGTSHTVAGNPGRFHSGQTAIAADDEWENSMPTGQRLLVTAMTAPLLHTFGYPLRKGRTSAPPERVVPV